MRRFIVLVVAALCGVCVSSAAAWTHPVSVTPLGQMSEGGVETFGLGDDGLLRSVWGQGHRLRLGLVSRRGVRRRVNVGRMSHPMSRPSYPVALAGGRTLVNWEHRRLMRLQTFSRRGRRIDSGASSGFSGDASPMSTPLSNGGALTWWGRQVRTGGHYVIRVVAALVTPGGTVGRPFTVGLRDDSTGEPTGDCIVAARDGHAVVAWTSSTSDDKDQLLVRRVSPDGAIGPVIVALPPAQSLRIDGGDIHVDVTGSGRVALSWLAASTRSRFSGRRWMRWISASDGLEPPVVVQSRTGRGFEAALHAIGDVRAVMFFASAHGVTSEIVDASGSISAR